MCCVVIFCVGMFCLLLFLFVFLDRQFLCIIMVCCFIFGFFCICLLLVSVFKSCWVCVCGVGLVCCYSNFYLFYCIIFMPDILF